MSASVVSTKLDEIVSISPLRNERQRCELQPKAEIADASATISDAVLPQACDLAKFAQEQTRGLIQRIFFPGWPKASRQVVISSADAQADTAGVCARIAREMAAGLPGTVCAVEADMHSPGLKKLLRTSVLPPVKREPDACIPVGENLWLAQPESIFGTENDRFSAAWLRTRLSELRRNFDYTLVHGPAAFLAQTIVLAQLADGLILVIEAGKTHRAVARTTLGLLKAAKVAVLGTVLTDRTFPIPEKLYSRL